MKITSMTLAAAFALTVAFTSCKPKDEDIQKTVQSTATTGVTVSVKDGVATLSGEVADDAAKANAEKTAKETKGVKSVTNNLTVPMPMVAEPTPALVEVAGDDVLMKSVNDAVKDLPTVAVTVMDGVVTLSGTIKKDKLPQLMMNLNSLKPKKIDNKLTVN